MKKNKNHYKLILQILFFISIFNVIYAKNVDNYYKASSISNYFSGIVSLNNNEHANAYKYLKKVGGLEDKHLNYSKYYIYSLINLEKINEAYKYSKELEKKNLDSFESNLIIGIYNLKNKKYVESSQYFQKLKTQSMKGSLQFLISSSLYNWTTFREKNSIEALELISKMPDQFRDIQAVLTHCFYDLNNTESKFKTLLNNKNDFSRYSFFYANYLYKQKKTDQAINIIDSALKKNPRNLLFKQMETDLTNQNTRHQSFKNIFDCQKISNNAAEILYIGSSLLSSQSIYSNANFFLILAKYLNPDFISYDALYAENLFKMKKYERAKNILKKISKKGRVYSWYASRQISQILFKEEREKEGAKYITDKFYQIEKPGIYEIYDFANFLKNNERFEEAITNYSKLLEMINFENDIYSSVSEGRGVAYERLGVWKKAEADLLNSLKKNPNQAYVINYLAYSWIEKGVNIEKSLKMLDKANKLKKNDGYITDSLGWALYKLKRYEDAKKYLQLAVTIMPADPIVNDHFADSLWMNNKFIQARYYWNYVLNLKKTDNKLKKIIKNKLIYGLNKKEV